jgi:phosphatidylserine/phosphatidylglycerophosphate/cardiolipin synthase-like enzyme
VRHPPLLATLAATIALAVLAGCELTPPLPPRADPPPTGAAADPVTLVVEPDAGPQAVLDLVAGARASLWMEMYLLTDARAIAALADRAAAGCDVRVILEPAPYQAAGANQAAYEALGSAGVDVRWAVARFSYTHAKTFTIDHARLAVLTLNLTGDGLGGNREYAAIDDDPADVAAAEAIFAADALGAATGGPGGRLVTSPETSRPALLALIEDARQALALETEELIDGAMVDALLAARARGVAVTLAWPGPATGAGASFTRLAAAGATVRAVSAPPIHGKVVVADGRTLYLGSANLSPTSLDDNREMGLLLQQPDVAARVAGVVAGDAATGLPPSP